MRIMSWLRFLGFCAALLACPPAAVNPPPDVSEAGAPAAVDAAGDPYAAACANLHSLGCAEADDLGYCATKLRQMALDRMTNVNPSCVAGARSADGVRACAPTWKAGCRGARVSP